MHKLKEVIFLLLVLIVFSCYARINDAKNPTAGFPSVLLAFTENPTEMSVSWYSPGRGDNSVVYFGESSGNYEFKVLASSGTYNASVGYYHHAILKNLKPATTYYYVCSDQNSGISAEYSFRSNPIFSNNSNANPIRIAIYGDMGAYHSENTIEHLTSRVVDGSIDWIYHLGDISYADEREPYEYASIWNRYFENILPLSAYIPYMATVGNNDIGCATCASDELPYARNFTEFRNRFLMPTNGPEGNMFYSWNYGPIHFVSISTETNFPDSASGGPNTQLDWLENDLREANKPENRAARPWIIVTGHKPMYSSSKEAATEKAPIGEYLKIQRNFEPLFRKYKVNIYFAGHVHVYERNYPVYNSVVTSTSYDSSKDTIHIISGAAGNIEGLNPWSTFLPTPPAWTAFRFVDSSAVDINDWRRAGYGILTIHHSKKLQWQFYQSSDDTLIDDVTITI